jgi:hypothetical protein
MYEVELGDPGYLEAVVLTDALNCPSVLKPPVSH